jgi:hypothetical protein
MARIDVLKECLAEALDEHAGVSVSDEALTAIAEDIEGFYDNLDLVEYRPANPLISETDRLRAELKRERVKVVCKECHGIGRIISYGPYHGSNTQCWKCHGEGKVKP